MKMKNRVPSLLLIGMAFLFAGKARGDEESARIPPLRLEAPKPESLNRFGLSFRMGFNVSTCFRNFGNFASALPQSPPLVTPDGDPYNYDNGYVYPDAGTANSGLTHYWGYQDASQLPGNGTILMQRSTSQGASPGFSSGDRRDDVLPGMELTYNRELGRIRKLHWGLEAAFNYMNVNINDRQPLRGRATVATSVLTDAYPLLVPENLMPPAPYTGRKNVPAVVIGASPTSSSTAMEQDSVTETVRGTRHFDADIFGFRLGPYLEMPLGGKVTAALSGGLSLAAVTSDFSFTETIEAGSVILPTRRGAGSHSDLLVGGYVEGNVSYALTQSAGLFAGVQFQDLGRYAQSVNRREAVLDLSRSIFATLGFSYSF